MAEPEDDMTAAEFALGVLEGQDRADAMRRLLADPEFAREVERWHDHFALLFAQWPEEAPLPRVEDRLVQAIAPAPPARWFWPILAGGASAVAAVLAGILVLQPGLVAPPPTAPLQAASPSLVASLAPAQGGTAVPAIYDPAQGEIQVAASALARPGRSAQLWLIPADGVPRSLGLLVEGTRTSVKLSPEHRRLIDARATLAVSSEPRGGSPSGKPTGPIVASGSLIPV